MSAIPLLAFGESGWGDELFRGVLSTLALAIVTLPIGMVLGLLLAFAKASREITYRILVGPQGPRLRQIVSIGAPAQRIAVAIRWLKEHIAEPLRIETLAKRVGMGPSALHLHFKNVTAMSPLQYQKQLRLQAAR